jgi:hypothetical protein
MQRTRRDAFDFDRLDDKRLSPDQRNRLLFDWLCNDADRRDLLKHLGSAGLAFESRAPIEDDPFPSRRDQPKHTHAKAMLVTDPKKIADILADNARYSSMPYAEIGGRSFMLALEAGDPEHAEQRRVAEKALAHLPNVQLGKAAEWAVHQAALLSLRSNAFDVVEFAEQAALRYFALLFGFATRDHALLEAATRNGYRALQYAIVGRHFVSEPALFPNAQAAAARLQHRASELMEDYDRLQREKPVPYGPGDLRQAGALDWPNGVQPQQELGLEFEPVLKRLPKVAGDLHGGALASMVVGLLVGSVGNVASSVARVASRWLDDRVQNARALDEQAWLDKEISLSPPVPMLARRDEQAKDNEPQDLILVLDALAMHPAGCPHAWGGGHAGKQSHECLGQDLARPIIAAVLDHLFKLPGLARRLDPLTGEVLQLERLWAMGCTRLPLQYERSKRRIQQPLIVAMRIKAPIAENAARLRQVIRMAAPRIEHVLQTSRHVHYAWFEFLEQDTVLCLHTIYDGDFEAYIEHFALKAGDLFDLIFEAIEGAPPLPVNEHPGAFIETIRRYNRAPAGGYFFSAHPLIPSSQIGGKR